MASDSTYCYKGTENFCIENGIIRGYEKPYLTKHTSYGAYVMELLKKQPDFIGQIDGQTDKAETFGLMLEKSIKCAIWLKRQNVQPGDVVGICTHNQLDMYIPCFAALYIGAIFNPWWEFNLKPADAKYYLNLTEPKVVFVNEKTASTVSETAKAEGVSPKIVVFGDVSGFVSLNEILESVDEKEVAEFRCTEIPDVGHPAMINFTSGTTGKPKGALHSHRSLFAGVGTSSAVKGLTTTLLFSSVSWISGVLGIMRGVAIPQRRIINVVYTPEIACQLIEKYKVNFLPLVSNVAVGFAQSPAISKYDLSSLRYSFIGGEYLSGPCQEAIEKTFPHVKVTQCYGSTELACFALRQTEQRKPGSCGKIIDNMSIKVVDPNTGRILDPNENGELCFKGPFMFSGYYRNPEATAETIDSEGWLHTGDIAYYDEEGNIFITNRMKEMIKCKANQVLPAVVEEVILRHPGVKATAVVGVRDDLDGEHPFAFVIKTEDSDVTADDLKKLVADALPDQMQLRGGVAFIDEFPYTTSGKIAKAKLREMAAAYIA